jgi:hypothetical protein
MECFINGQSLGPITPFDKDRFAAQAISGYFPAFSFTSFQQATFNFGASEFKYVYGAILCINRVYFGGNCFNLSSLTFFFRRIDTHQPSHGET